MLHALDNPMLHALDNPMLHALGMFVLNLSTVVTNLHQRSQNMRHLYSGMGLKLGGLFFYIYIQNNCGSSGAYVNPLWPKREDKTCVKLRMTCEDCGHIGFVLFLCA